MIVVDTNIVVHLLIDGTSTDNARTLWAHDSDWQLPELWRHEFLNVLATLVRQSAIPVANAENIWGNAWGLLANSLHSVDANEVLHVAADTQISAYDAQFVVLAQTLGTLLVTEDRQLQRRFPQLAVSLQEYPM